MVATITLCAGRLRSLCERTTSHTRSADSANASPGSLSPTTRRRESSASTVKRRRSRTACAGGSYILVGIVEDRITYSTSSSRILVPWVLRIKSNHSAIVLVAGAIVDGVVILMEHTAIISVNTTINERASKLAPERDLSYPNFQKLATSSYFRIVKCMHLDSRCGRSWQVHYSSKRARARSRQHLHCSARPCHRRHPPDHRFPIRTCMHTQTW